MAINRVAVVDLVDAPIATQIFFSLSPACTLLPKNAFSMHAAQNLILSANDCSTSTTDTTATTPKML
jgi:hypothetical protein